MDDYYNHVRLITARNVAMEEEQRREAAERARHQAVEAAADAAANVAALVAATEQVEAGVDQQVEAQGGAGVAANPGEALPQGIELEAPRAPVAPQPHHGGGHLPLGHLE